MRRILAVVAFVGLVFAAGPSVADVTIKITTSTNTGATTTEESSVIYIKGTRGRIDAKGPGMDWSCGR